MFVTATGRPLTPFGSLRRLSNALDEAFSPWPFGDQESGTLTSAWVPACDVFENSDAVKIMAEVPGVRPEDVKLSLEHNLLTLRGEKRQSADERNERLHRSERVYGPFERVFSLSSAVDPSGITASYDHGVLSVTIPKVERARPREIPVQVS